MKYKNLGAKEIKLGTRQLYSLHSGHGRWTSTNLQRAVQLYHTNVGTLVSRSSHGPPENLWCCFAKKLLYNRPGAFQERQRTTGRRRFVTLTKSTQLPNVWGRRNEDYMRVAETQTTLPYCTCPPARVISQKLQSRHVKPSCLLITYILIVSQTIFPQIPLYFAGLDYENALPKPTNPIPDTPPVWYLYDKEPKFLHLLLLSFHLA